LADLILVFAVVFTVNTIDELQNCGLSDYLLDRVHTKKDSLLQANEIGFVAIKEF
jgi:hypothetical protein